MEPTKYSSHQKFNYIIGEFIKKLYNIVQENDKSNFSNNNTNMNTNITNTNNDLETNLTDIYNYTKLISESSNLQNSSNKQNKIFNSTVTQIDELIDTMIDRCIKNKIYYYIKNNIGYTQLKLTFKTHLSNYLHELINTDNLNLNNYLNHINPDDLDNYSDINSILLNKLKSNDTKRISFNKNNISKDTDNTSDSDDSDNSDDELPINTNKNKNTKSIIKIHDSNNLSINQKLAIYIKILITQGIKMVEFIDKLTKMCLILYDPNIQYNLADPYE